MRNQIMQASAPNAAVADPCPNNLLAAVQAIGVAHQILIDLVSRTIEGLQDSDLNGSQILLLLRIGTSPPAMSCASRQEHYQPVSASYNIRKLLDLGYIRHRQSATRKRGTGFCLTDKGTLAKQHVVAAYAKQMSSLPALSGLSPQDLGDLAQKMDKLSLFWSHQVKYRL